MIVRRPLPGLAETAERNRALLQSSLPARRAQLAASVATVGGAESNQRAFDSAETIKARPPAPAGGVPLADALPPLPGSAPPSVPRLRPRVWQGSIDRAPRWRTDFDSVWRKARPAFHLREIGEPSVAWLEVILGKLVWLARKHGAGLAQVSAAELAALAGCCEDTARRCRDWLEDHGIVALIVARVRIIRGGIVRVWNGAAVAVFPEASPSPPPADVATVATVATVTAPAIMQRWLAAAGAVLRPQGWINPAPARPRPP
jgi:hypothetical protein